MKEVADFTEREVKYWDCDHIGLLDLVKILQSDLAPEHRLLIRKPRTTIDVYLDTQNFTLYNLGATLRLRKRSVKAGWSVNFKPVAEQEDGRIFMQRREVISHLSVNETVAALRAGSDCKAFVLAEELCNDYKGIDFPTSKTLLITNRITLAVSENERYVPLRIFPKDAGPALIYVILDSVIAVDITQSDLEPLIRSQVSDITNHDSIVSFSCLEIEASGRQIGREDFAVDLMILVAEQVRKKLGLVAVHDTKYARSVRQLGMV